MYYCICRKYVRMALWVHWTQLQFVSLIQVPDLNPTCSWVHVHACTLWTYCTIICMYKEIKEKTTYLSEICFMWAWFISWMLHYVKNCQWKGCNYYICYFYSMYITHCIHMCVCVCVLIENWFNCFSLMVCCFGLINYSNFVIQSL